MKQSNKHFSNLALIQFSKGFQAAIPIIIGYIPTAISFGIVSTENNLSEISAVLMSAAVHAAASQFMAVAMLSKGVPILEIVIATLFINLRHIVMNLSLLPKLHNLSGSEKALISLGITDETFAVASLTKDSDIRSVSGMAGLVISAFLAWVIGTVLGVWLAEFIPQTVSGGVSVALYAMFIALLVPALKQKPQCLLVVGVAIVTKVLLQNSFSLGWSLVIATILGSFVFPFVERKGIVYER
ncbi:AzlC family protein (plasmid) [Stanieria cyanosphaera PCC 7437]|uniref:AzlC family protein n=1 Tax=Stanieria cyanosphaera (strain ATCC 29371 / PCC 7437) TaxID=111780 RepID=K9Y264_STAC7|nr:AzlC family ABC transporter permease [Stanieria cyanosphaera]AFZ38062.1 AzlC family protein [Stanieria cyanosphaera PCC 7437]